MSMMSSRPSMCSAETVDDTHLVPEETNINQCLSEVSVRNLYEIAEKVQLASGVTLYLTDCRYNSSGGCSPLTTKVLKKVQQLLNK